MAESYFKYDFRAFIFYKLLSKVIFNTLSEEINFYELKKYKKHLKKTYKALLRRTETIEKSPEMNSALYMAMVLFSAHKANPEIVNEKMFETITIQISKAPFLQKSLLKRNPFSEKEQAIKKQEAEDSQKFDFKYGWKFTHELKGNEFFTTYTKCGICDLAKKEGCMPLVTYICRLDFITYDLMGTKLIRTKTIGDGDDICDFHVVLKS